jgi:hypothetical protein
MLHEEGAGRFLERFPVVLLGFVVFFHDVGEEGGARAGHFLFEHGRLDGGHFCVAH